jgi:hypothetical protein
MRIAPFLSTASFDISQRRKLAAIQKLKDSTTLQISQPKTKRTTARKLKRFPQLLRRISFERLSNLRCGAGGCIDFSMEGIVSEALLDQIGTQGYRTRTDT